MSEAILNHVSGSRGGVVGVYQRHSWDAAKKATLAAWAANVVSLGACDGRRTFPSGLNQTPHTRQAMSQKGGFRPFRDHLQLAGMRKKRSLPDGLATGSNRPDAAPKLSPAEDQKQCREKRRAAGMLMVHGVFHNHSIAPWFCRRPLKNGR